MAASAWCVYGESWLLTASSFAWSAVQPYVGWCVEPYVLVWKIDDFGAIAPERAAACAHTTKGQPLVDTIKESDRSDSTPTHFRSRSQSMPEIVPCAISQASRSPPVQNEPLAADGELLVKDTAPRNRRASLRGWPTFRKSNTESTNEPPPVTTKPSTPSPLTNLLAHAKSIAQTNQPNNTKRPSLISRRRCSASVPGYPAANTPVALSISVPAAPVTTTTTTTVHLVEKLTLFSPQSMQRQWHTLARALPSSLRQDPPALKRPIGERDANTSDRIMV